MKTSTIDKAFAAMRRNWAVTVPKTVAWSAYEKELTAAAAGADLNYRVRGFPKAMKIGDRCYIVHDGRVRGWMTISSLTEKPDPWQCETTGAVWPAGKYLVRTGKFHPIDGPEMTGFRGVRRIEIDW
jgi:hypothetical protein